VKNKQSIFTSSSYFSHRPLFYLQSAQNEATYPLALTAICRAFSHLTSVHLQVSGKKEARYKGNKLKYAITFRRGGGRTFLRSNSRLHLREYEKKEKEKKSDTCILERQKEEKEERKKKGGSRSAECTGSLRNEVSGISRQMLRSFRLRARSGRAIARIKSHRPIEITSILRRVRSRRRVAMFVLALHARGKRFDIRVSFDDRARPRWVIFPSLKDDPWLVFPCFFRKTGTANVRGLLRASPTATWLRNIWWDFLGSGARRRKPALHRFVRRPFAFSPSFSLALAHSLSFYACITRIADTGFHEKLA